MTGVPVTRRYLRDREVRDLPTAVHSVAEVIADWEQLRVRTALQTTFRRESRVVLRRPWWMPVRLYRTLLRSIVCETRDATPRGA